MDLTCFYLKMLGVFLENKIDFSYLRKVLIK